MQDTSPTSICDANFAKELKGIQLWERKDRHADCNEVASDNEREQKQIEGLKRVQKAALQSMREEGSISIASIRTISKSFGSTENVESLKYHAKLSSKMADALEAQRCANLEIDRVLNLVTSVESVLGNTSAPVKIKRKNNIKWHGVSHSI